MLRHALFCGAIAIACIVSQSTSEAQAQGCGLQNGYQFGVGMGYNNYIGQLRTLAPHDRPPHFSLFPPVYYSDIITPRPYGISPFAAPPGIRPTELDVLVAPEPETVMNPYFRPTPDGPQTTPKSDASGLKTAHQSKSETVVNNTTETIINPFFVDRRVVSNK